MDAGLPYLFRVWMLAIGQAKKALPLEWRVRVPKLGIDVFVTTNRPNSWLATAFPYWEGPVTVARVIWS
jgi:predicted secreted hydrolase